MSDFETSKPLSKRIANRADQTKSARNKQSLASFLAQQDEITEALDVGWSVQQIWMQLNHEEKFLSGYQMFLRLVNKHCRKSGPLNIQPDPSRITKTIEKQEKGKTENEATQEPRPLNIEGFNFDSTINEKDII